MADTTYMDDAFDIPEATYRDMTEEHLGDMATSEDLETFIADCEAYQELTNCTDAEATDYVWGNGDWYPRVVATPAHTPTPWTIGRGRRWITSGDLDIARIHSVSKIGEAEAVANAEFIVRACNSHYALVEALETIVEDIRDDESFSSIEDIALLFRAEQAIAKAKEEVTQ